MAKHTAVAQTVPAAPAAPAASAAQPANMDTIHVLVVDDESVIRTVVRSALEEVGYVVHEAPDGLLAMEKLLLSPQSLVVVLDLMMPRMSGIEVMEFLATEPVWARRHSIIVLTAMTKWAMSQHLQSLMEQLAATVVAKPFDLDELLGVVAAAARRLVPA